MITYFAHLIGIKSATGLDTGMKQLRRFFVPRRKDNVVKCALLITFALLLIYYYQNSNLISDRSASSKEDRWIYPMEHKIPNESNRNGVGEYGKPVIVTGSAEDRVQEDMKKWFMNVYASDIISLDRSIPDTRSQECRRIVYPLDLPTASVIVIFTDEAWSPLMRTVHSIVNRSPHILLREVLLVDDFSQRNELKGKLDKYIKRFGGLVRLKRSNERLGLIRAKLLGAKFALGDVVVFLDSHCEVNTGWLEPILARIKEKKSAVVCPVIDQISAETLEYDGQSYLTSIGSFSWSLHFSWISIPSDQQPASVIEPVRSPTMAGGLLAADRDYFFHIGSYDSEMDIWGGENLEISFRVWMCGGSIEFIPCSHVGHIFRAGHPYNMTGRGGNLDVHGTNSKRLAEVWMDDYKRFYYMHRIVLRNKDVGDLSERKALRKKLNCKSFKWYLENIAKHKFILDENVNGYGALKNNKTELCLDTLQRDEKMTAILGVFSCQDGGSSSQVFSLTKEGYLRREATCASINYGTFVKTKVTLSNCIGLNEKWSFEGGQMKHVKSKKCMDVDGLGSGDDVLLTECVPGKETQLWSFQHLYQN